MSITYIIIGITVLISFLAFSNNELKGKAIFHPYGVKRNNAFFKFLTHGFIHADYMHLAFNMLTLYFFGPTVETAYTELFGVKSGPLFYIILYFVGIIVAALPSFIKNRDNPYYRSLGASGAVSAVLFASIIISPMAGIGLLIIPGLFIPAWIFGFLYLGYSAYMAKRGRDHIAHDAHFVGAVFGILLTLALRPSLWNQFVQTVTQWVANFF